MYLLVVLMAVVGALQHTDRVGVVTMAQVGGAIGLTAAGIMAPHTHTLMLAIIRRQ
jgi:hypothetical protein